MRLYGVFVVLCSVVSHYCHAQCPGGRSVTFTRWSGVAPETATPVFVYTASGDEESLAGSCLTRCKELEDCAAVVVAYGRGNCQGIADSTKVKLNIDSDVAYFKKVCLELPEDCANRWWSLDNTPGYNLHSDSSHLKVVLNVTIFQCYDAVFKTNGDRTFRSAQWVLPDGPFDPEMIYTSDSAVGNCILNLESRFTEPESYRVSNYYTIYVENQCTHDYPKKIDRCSYEEYHNQTLRHVEYTIKNYTKDECKTSCEIAERFICRGFTWITHEHVGGTGARGLCDLHSEDLITTGSWLLRRVSSATYYRRVICLNISVECENSEMIVTYKPRGEFRGRMYVPGRGDSCGARGTGSDVRLTLPMRGHCDVNFAYGITYGPAGLINRTMAYVIVMIQNNPIIQTAGDRWVRVGCSPGVRTAKQVEATFAVTDIGNGYKMATTKNHEPVTPAAASAVFGASRAPLTMYVVRPLDDTSAGAASLGEPLELRIETTEPEEIQAYRLVASSRLGDSSVLLLDNRGCPTGQVDFPPFTRSWSGGTQRLSAKFKAFRFPTSHIVRFALMIRFCNNKCPPIECGKQNRNTRQTNETYYQWEDEVKGAVKAAPMTSQRGAIVAEGGAPPCATADSDTMSLVLEMTVDSRDIMSADTLVRADHRSIADEVTKVNNDSMVCIHELLLVSLALAWLAVQIMLLLGCCVLVKRYRNLAEMSMQKDYHSFDNVGFDNVSTHRRVHWPDQNIDILHTT